MSIADFQRALAARGFDPGPFDGEWGPRTAAAAMSAIGPPPDRVVNDAALALIKEREGFRSRAYQDDVGVWTIGYGTTARAGVGIEPKAGMAISEPEAELYLLAALDKFAGTIRPAVTREATPNQWGAMLSLAYNIGPEAFKRSSALRYFNAGNTQAAADAFRLWKKAGGRVLPGLVRRREAERTLFLS